MVPMADMLNAGYGVDNARLFGDDEEEDDLEGNISAEEGYEKLKLGPGYTMITTKEIKSGEQIVSRDQYPVYPAPAFSVPRPDLPSLPRGNRGISSKILFRPKGSRANIRDCETV